MDHQGCKKVVKRWENLDSDILMRIFQNHLSLNEWISGFAHVCRGWRAVCCDPILWNTLDLSHMISDGQSLNVIRVCDKEVTRFLKLSMSLSKGNIRTLIFPVRLILTEDMLTYTAERCPNLRRLVLPIWYGIYKTVISKAISFCKNLESLTMPSVPDPQFVFSSIFKRREFRELKVLGPVSLFFAENLVEYLPELKVLSLRCIAIDRDALIKILDELKSLEILNISHSYLVEKHRTVKKKKTIVRELDEMIMKKASKLKRFFTCMEHKTCVLCQRTEEHKGTMRWSSNEEELWQTDEVTSLHL